MTSLARAPRPPAARPDRRPRAVLALLAAVLAAGLGGCAALPTAGDVRPGITATPTDVGYAQFVPQDPAAGADPHAIVQGFLLATQAGAGEDFAAARRYLTPAAAAAWEPLGEVNLYSDARPPDPVAPLEGESDAAAVEVRVPFDLVGTVDAEGRYAPVPATASAQNFTVTQDSEGRWRISVAPSGILLSLGEFVTQFRASTAYFLDSSGRILVPDVRWFARGDAAAEVVDAFLAGPPEWLAGTTRNPLPAGTTATVAALESAAGESLRVTLSRAAASTPAQDRSRVAAALAAALADLPGAARVEVWCGGARWTVPPSGAPQVAAGDDSARPYLVSARDGEDAGLGYLDGAELVPVEGFDPAGVGALTALAVADDGATLAGLDGEGRVVRLRQGEGPAQVVAPEAAGVAPVFDSWGRLWVAQAGGGSGSGSGAGAGSGQVASFPPSGAGKQVEAPWLVDEEVLALAPAPDAIRLLVVSREDTGAVRVRLAAIQRDPWGVPVALGDPIGVATLPGAPAGVAWVDPLTAVFLAPEAESGEAVAELWPHLLTVGGLASAVRPPGGAESLVAVAAGSAGQDLLALAESGDLYARVGTRWEKRAASIRLAAYPAAGPPG